MHTINFQQIHHKQKQEIRSMNAYLHNAVTSQLLPPTEHRI